MSTIKATTLSTLTGSYSTGTERCIRGAAAAWVNFNGTGVVAIRDSYNVSSITDVGTGDYTVNFTVAMASTNFATLVSARVNAGITGSYPKPDSVLTVSSIAVQTIVIPSTATDAQHVFVGIFSN